MVAQEAQCGHEADARRGGPGRVRRGHSERPQQVMSDEQTIDLLEDADWALAVTGTRRSLMGLELIHHQLDFPALVVRKKVIAARRRMFTRPRPPRSSGDAPFDVGLRLGPGRRAHLAAQRASPQIPLLEVDAAVATGDA